VRQKTQVLRDIKFTVALLVIVASGGVWFTVPNAPIIASVPKAKRGSDENCLLKEQR